MGNMELVYTNYQFMASLPDHEGNLYTCNNYKKGKN